MISDNILKRRGGIGSNCCILCNRGAESIDHPLVHCLFSQQVSLEVSLSLQVAVCWTQGSFEKSLVHWVTNVGYFKELPLFVT